MKITILCVGKIKEKFFGDAVNEYLKRLSRYAKLEIKEYADEKTPDGAGEALEEEIRIKEGHRILSGWDENAYTFILAIDGKGYSSEAFAGKIEEVMLFGKSHIQFVIGGSLGLSDEVIKKGDVRLSFSNMTFPHQLMRVILLEQIYRAFRIMKNEPYHK
ncbi:MAG: 23S rRNA (pseudouridine(1915)-N(3))-methyltransferase RlmH [Clostridiales bacterium]|nr:23S rRNA (pseudouridine(1915)-N(3))-methyltransferase RlmH [Clostridiales bacterium]